MDRVALVTGGTRGIGRAISELLVKDGFKVAANYAGNDEAANKCAEELGISVFKFDVGDYDACQEGIKAIEESIGSVDVLVNNAGITRDAMLHKMTREQWDDVIRVDLTSAFNLSQAVINGMRDKNWGRIINISSINGQKGQMGQTNYSAAKAGLIGFSKALAQETARKGITVNTVCPGYTDTDMVAAVPEKVLDSIISTIPVGRLGKSEEIAACVSFLASDGAAFVTGATLAANGGQYIPT
ncbi:acetoacetyl-CoA reductase [Hirschia maritima]|uniref:acetoacetyl-CoA reductase n=1 Tax=Hirschia maritima TaxID=1121961 RepID=UPI00037E5B59|nr:acetoacetyl-CoA reductase [Hirschia maritima]